MMPMRMRRKCCELEKVENLFCTATARKFLLTRAQKRSRLRDLCRARGARGAVQCRTAQDQSVKCEQHQESQRYASGAGNAARQHGHDPACGEHADFERAEAARQAMSRKKRNC